MFKSTMSCFYTVATKKISREIARKKTEIFRVHIKPLANIIIGQTQCHDWENI